MVPLFKDVLGADRVHERPMSMGGEDFSQFTRAGIRSFYYHLGSAAPEAVAESKKPGGKALASTHSPFYAPVPRADAAHRRVDDEHGDFGADE